MADLRIVEFTDPGCPFAFSAEPVRRRVQWLYGDQIDWDVRVIVLADSAEAYEARGFTPEMQERGYAHLAREHGMPIDASRRPRMAATQPACRAVVAARLNAGPARARALLRALAVAHFAGSPLDEDATIDAAAPAAGIGPGVLAGCRADAATGEALADDMRAARTPPPAALAQPDRLAASPEGMRFTCPSYEFERPSDAARMSVPGFQPLRAYEVAIANLAPHLDRREPPSGPVEVLRAIGEPLATVELAEVMGVDAQAAREACTDAGLVFAASGADGYWGLGPAAV